MLLFLNFTVIFAKDRNQKKNILKSIPTEMKTTIKCQMATSVTLSRSSELGFGLHEGLRYLSMVNMDGRMYDPDLGRFISPDPFIQDASLSQNINRYVYCLNNPLTYKDETGELFIIDDWIIGGIKGLFKGENFFKSANRHAKNAVKIWGGLFTLDSNKSFFGKMWEFVSRFTFQLPQTVGGLLTSHGYNMIGNVLAVNYKFGATVVTTTSFGDGGAVTLGSFIIGDKNLRADPFNKTFQHEYGHYLQSQSMGWAYLFRVGIPSIISASKRDGSHRHRSYERDANRRSFMYMNKYVSDFYMSEEEYNYGKRIWDFKYHPIRPKGEKEYVDYREIQQFVNELLRHLSISAKFDKYIMPIP